MEVIVTLILKFLNGRYSLTRMRKFWLSPRIVFSLDNATQALHFSEVEYY